jgi:hypothetical protein
MANLILKLIIAYELLLIMGQLDKIIANMPVQEVIKAVGQ